jgi:hypothetical protein
MVGITAGKEVIVAVNVGDKVPIGMTTGVIDAQGEDVAATAVSVGGTGVKTSVAWVRTGVGPQETDTHAMKKMIPQTCHFTLDGPILFS